MTALPERLRAWAAPLAALHEELAIALAPGLARLAELFSPPRPGRDGEHGELHGYDGLTRRGSPERLLMSEWLLALEVSDEFVRRAALGEQAYLRPAFRRPKPERRCVVLLDAGPEQAGSPRVAHLALLVVLARRAEAAGAHFAWGVLQAPPSGGLAQRVEARSVGPWLRRSHAEPATGARLAAWREHLEAERMSGEVWLVGGPRLARLPGAEGLSRVAVDEVLEPGARRLTVEVWPAAGGTRRGELELPGEAHCVRLLRDPFRAESRVRPLPTSHGPVRFLRFCANGLRLLVGHEDGGVSALMVPNSTHATVARPKRFMPGPGMQLVACGWRYHGGLLVLARRENTLRLYGALDGKNVGSISWKIEGAGPRLPEAGQPPLLAWSRRGSYRYETLMLWDAQGDVYELPREASVFAPKKSPRAEVYDLASSTRLAENVVALQEPEGHCFVVGADPRGQPSEGLRVECLGVEHRQLAQGSDTVVLGPGAIQVKQVCYIQETAKVVHGPSLAARGLNGTWWILPDAFHSAEKEHVRVPTVRGRVVGLAQMPGETMELALVVLDDDERTFWWWTARGPRPLTKAPGRVRSACVGEVLPVLAWSTEQGEVGLWNFRLEVLVHRLFPGGKP